MALVNQVQDFVTALMESNLSGLYTYHNLKHTIGVVDAVKRLCDEEKVAALDKKMVLTAAWFHDTGYTKGCIDHENSSIEIAAAFLRENQESEEFIAAVSGLIRATTKEFVPQTLLERIIKDADYFHILDDDYVLKCESLRTEWANVEGKSFTEIEWLKENDSFCQKAIGFIHHTQWTTGSL